MRRSRPTPSRRTARRAPSASGSPTRPRSRHRNDPGMMTVRKPLLGLLGLVSLALALAPRPAGAWMHAGAYGAESGGGGSWHAEGYHGSSASGGDGSWSGHGAYGGHASGGSGSWSGYGERGGSASGGGGSWSAKGENGSTASGGEGSWHANGDNGGSASGGEGSWNAKGQNGST